MGDSEFIVRGNIFYNNQSIGVDSSLLSPGGNVFDIDPGFINPSQGLYTSTLTGKGYSSTNVTSDYNKMVFANSAGSGTPTLTTTDTFRFGRDALAYNRFSQYGFGPTISLDNKYSIRINDASGKSLALLVKGLLNAKNDLLSKEKMQLDLALIAKLVEQSLRDSALSLPAGEISPYEMQTAEALAGIINNPTDVQLVIIEAIEGLIKEQKEDEDLTPATDALTEMLVTLLVTQAFPELIKEGDVSGMKLMFAEIGTETKIALSRYQAAVSIYYTNMVEMLAKNMGTLKARGLLPKDITSKEDFARMPHQRIDEMLARIHNMKERTATIKSIITFEATYKKALETARMAFEERVEGILKTYASGVLRILEGRGAKKN